MLVHVVVSMLLLAGVYKRKENLMLPWVIMGAVGVIGGLEEAIRTPLMNPREL